MIMVANDLDGVCAARSVPLYFVCNVKETLVTDFRELWV